MKKNAHHRGGGETLQTTGPVVRRGSGHHSTCNSAYRHVSHCISNGSLEVDGRQQLGTREGQGDFNHGVSAPAVARVAMERRELIHRPVQWTKELGTQVIYTKHACEYYRTTLTSSHPLFRKSLRTILAAYSLSQGCYWTAAQLLTANLPTDHISHSSGFLELSLQGASLPATSFHQNCISVRKVQEAVSLWSKLRKTRQFHSAMTGTSLACFASAIFSNGRW